MANRLISLEEYASDVVAFLDKMSPAEQRAALYGLQISLGGFPRDLEKEKEISMALEGESALSAQ